MGGDGKPKPLTYGSIAKDAPQWSSDGKLIAFMVGGVVKVVQPNGNGLDQIYPPPHRGVSSDQNTQDVNDSFKVPPISSFKLAAGTKSLAAVQVMEGDVAATAGATGWWQHSGGGATEPDAARSMEAESIIVLPALEPKPFLLKDSDAQHASICWFPDSVRVAVAMQTGRGVHLLRVYRADVKDIPPDHLIVAQGATIMPQNPAVSPDGSKVAVEIWKITGTSDSEIMGIAVIPAEPGKPYVIRSGADIAKLPLVIKGHVTGPQWSPDGSRLLYSKPSDKGNRDIWVASADGTNQVNVTKGVGDCFDAVWSPATR